METIIARQPVFNHNKKDLEVDKQDMHMLYLEATAYADNLESL